MEISEQDISEQNILANALMNNPSELLVLADCVNIVNSVAQEKPMGTMNPSNYSQASQG